MQFETGLTFFFFFFPNNNQMRQRVGSNFSIGLCIAAAFLVIALRVFAVRKSKYNRPGSVADLVRRGQLRSDRRGMYDSNPFSRCRCVELFRA